MVAVAVLDQASAQALAVDLGGSFPVRKAGTTTPVEVSGVIIYGNPENLALPGG
jgi:hypothetical protein